MPHQPDDELPIPGTTDLPDLQHQSYRSNLIIDRIESVLFSLDREWRFTYLNHFAARLWQRPKDNLIGKIIWEEFPGLVGTPFEKYYRQTMEQAIPNQFEEYSPISHAWYEVQSYPTEQGIIVHFQNIDTRKHLEQSLKESEARYKTLSEAAFEGVILHREGRIVDANTLAARMLGYHQPHELIGQTIEQHLTPETLALLQKRIAEGSEESYEGIAIRKDGSQFPVEARGKLAEYHGQTVRVKVLRDITERKQAEETLRRTQAQLLQSQKMEGIGRLAGGIAHDFNNLLTAITGYTDLILLKLDQTNPNYNYLLEIEKAAERATNLTGQLLAFSRQQVLQPKRLNLNRVVTEIDKMLHRLIGEDIDLQAILDLQLREVLADPGQIEQVIMNLAINARDAMPDGGKLTIETANVELDEAYQASGHPQFKTGSYVMLAVSDTGTGMDEATQAQIFEPFFTTKEKGKGTGLGLATVYGIVEQSGGHILVYSELGLGTTFKIYLPLVQKELSNKESQTTSHRASLKRSLSTTSRPSTQSLNVLVVEDDDLVRNLIHQILTEANYTLFEAQNGEEALEILRSQNGAIDLVISDIVMPKMGGRELIVHLKEHLPGLNVLCMSGYTDQSVVRHGVLSECDSFLQKPFTPRDLLSRIEDILKDSIPPSATES